MISRQSQSGYLIRFLSIIFIAANQDWAAQEQTVRLYNLQMERERLRRRQQEIKSHVKSFECFIWILEN